MTFATISPPSHARTARPVLATALLLALAACDGTETSAPTAGRPVQVVRVEASKLAGDVDLSGEIQAESKVGEGTSIRFWLETESIETEENEDEQ